jgi:hypothetical protein
MSKMSKMPKMSNSGPSRRSFFKGAAAAAGLYGAARLLGPRALGSAYAADPGDAPALLVLYLRGGYNALFCSADSFIGSGAFGVTSSNVRRIGQSDLVVDLGSLGSLPVAARQKMASIGVRHGLSSHPAAQKALWNEGNRSYPIQLSRALGGDAAIRCAALGQMPPGEHRASGDVSLQRVRDLSTTIAALGGITSANAPSREMAAAGLVTAESMSAPVLDRSPASAASLIEGYPAAIGMLSQEAQTFDYAEMAQAYGIQPGGNGSYPTAVQNIRTQMLGAELMIRAGANVVTVVSRGWDSHGDRNGSAVRSKMSGALIQSLGAFVGRTLAMPGRNVVTAIFGDFSRSLPGSDHQANLTATVIGKHVKLGTTGRVNARVGLPAGTPGIQGMWAYIAAALQAPDRPFCSNPHGLLV